MRSPRLNTLQRLGIILSIAWAISACIYQRSADFRKANEFADWSNRVCVEGIPYNKKTGSDCDKERPANFATFMDGWDNAASLAIIPIPFGWLSAYIGFGVAKVITTGSRATFRWGLMKWPSRLLFAVAVVFSLGVSYIVITSILNLYAEIAAPVTLKGKSYTDMNLLSEVDNDIIIEGTWVRNNDELVPLQASKIVCHSSTKSCIESTGRIITGGVSLLDVDTMEYPIRSWTDKFVVFEDDQLCSAETYTIDRAAQSLTGVGHLANLDSKLCNHIGKSAATWEDRLTDGFPVYWKQFRKSRPFLLKLIQAPFSGWP